MNMTAAEELESMMEEEKKRFEPYWRKCIIVRCTV